MVTENFTKSVIREKQIFINFASRENFCYHFHEKDAVFTKSLRFHENQSLFMKNRGFSETLIRISLNTLEIFLKQFETVCKYLKSTAPK